MKFGLLRIFLSLNPPPFLRQRISRRARHRHQPQAEQAVSERAASADGRQIGEFRVGQHKLSFALPDGTFGAVVARSGLASKQGLRPANCLGVIDSDYRGECFVALHNDSSEERTVRHGDRVAQLVLLPFLPMEFEEVDELPATVRGEGGFGSTGR